MSQEQHTTILHYATRGLLARMAWRNLWRNRKRTIIAGASVTFAVFFAAIMSSLQTGSHEYMIQSAVSFYTGHLQLQGRGYWEKRSLDESIAIDSSLVERVRSTPHVAHLAARLETAALVSHGNATRVSPVIGVNPQEEDAMTGFGRRMVRGAALSQWSTGVVIAEGLARILSADVGDSIVIYGQGYHGVTAAAVERIAGIVKFPIPDLNNAMVYLPLASAQDLFAAPGRVTSLALLLDTDKALDATASALKGVADDGMVIMTWKEMMPELLQAIAVDDGGTVIMLLILYIVIGFGIFGTVMMMTAERTREFGVTIALGMKRWRLMSVVIGESLMISVMGACAGLALAIPVVGYFVRFPIRLGGDYAKAMLAYGMEPVIILSTDPIIFLIQGIVVFALGSISALYPVFFLRRLEPVEAMHK